jgi:hypothetical protein
MAQRFASLRHRRSSRNPAPPGLKTGAPELKAIRYVLSKDHSKHRRSGIGGDDAAKQKIGGSTDE